MEKWPNLASMSPKSETSKAVWKDVCENRELYKALADEVGNDDK
jgi:hypothetical protein